MPLAVENLNKNSSVQSIRDAISSTIAKLMREGKSQKDAAGQAYSMARSNTGKSLKGG